MLIIYFLMCSLYIITLGICLAHPIIANSNTSFNVSSILTDWLQLDNEYTLLKQTSVYSESPIVEYQNKPIKRMRMSSCEAITKAQVERLITEYPNFIVTCEKEMTLLYPSEIDKASIQRKLTSVQKKLKMSEVIQKSLGKIQFTEMEVSLKQELDSLQILLSSCIYLSNKNASGALEFKFTIGAGGATTGGVTVGAPIPFFGIKSAMGIGTSLSRKFVIDHSCNFDGYGVRPVVTLTTIEFHVRSRIWEVGQFPTIGWKKSKWNNQKQAVFTDDAPIFSCLSELYVPGVCRWPSDRARDEDGDEVRIIEVGH